jgi:hypothetical protein
MNNVLPVAMDDAHCKDKFVKLITGCAYYTVTVPFLFKSADHIPIVSFCYLLVVWTEVSTTFTHLMDCHCVFKAVVMNHEIYWNILSCGVNITEVPEEYITSKFIGQNQPRNSYSSATTWFLLRLILDPEEGGDIFLQNVNSHNDRTALYPWRWQH